MSPADATALGALREEIETVDAAIIDALAARMALAKQIREVKQRAGLAIIDPAREAAVVARVAERARDAGLPEDEIRALYWRVMAVARRAQMSLD
jgi:chorismate mutase